MERHGLAGVLILAVGAVGLVVYYFARPWIEDLRQRGTSDAAAIEGTISVGVDNWVGYFPLCSPAMKKRMRDRGWALRCEDDNADYAARMARLAGGELQFAVATVDSYLLNGAAEGFPATIVMVIDESKGGDAVVSRKAAFAGIDDLKARPELRVAFTPSSPSEHLLKAVATHFDIPALRGSGDWRVEADGSSAARELLESGKVDVAVLWEPDVSRALRDPAFGKLLGTEDTRKLIVDVLLVSRDFSRDEPELVKLVLHEYFRTLKYYRDDPEQLRADVAERTRLSETEVDSMLQGVAWMTLHDNASRWFGLAQRGQFAKDGIVDAIDATLQILTEAGDFAGDPLPDQDPYRILHSEPLEFLFSEGSFGAFAGDGAEQGSARDFGPLDEAGWEKLREVGTLKVRPITFQSGTDALGPDGKEELDKAVTSLSHYPNFRIIVKGHTGLRGDAAANRALSQRRAEAVARYLRVTHDVDENRVRAVGKGSSEPLPRLPGEGERRYQYRLPRVEMFLVTEVY